MSVSISCVLFNQVCVIKIIIGNNNNIILITIILI